MTKRALLILTQSLNDIKLNLNSIIESSISYTSESLYVYINPLISNSKVIQHVQPTTLVNDRYLIKLITNSFYKKTLNLKPQLDVKCLLHNVTQLQIKPKINYELILTDLLQSDNLNSKLKTFCFDNLPSGDGDESDRIQVVNLAQVVALASKEDLFEVTDNECDLIHRNKIYDYSIVAGTFDRLHVGHKILLSESVLLTKKKLLIGITDDIMIQKKTLYELIQPLGVRIENVKRFLNTIAPHLEIVFAPLSDPFGPSITESEYECLIVSKETTKGGAMVNVKRNENKLKSMDIHVISLVDDDISIASEHDEQKVSSSNQRKRLLGTLLREPYIPYDSEKPYVIGLTGGLASGKSSIRKRLEKLGAVTVDCDLLGHQTYTKGTNAYEKLIDTFGKEILSEDLNINRRALGALVFGKPNELKKLTDIVWPEIRKLIEAEIEKLYESGHRIIIVEAAVLIEAQWDSVVNEIWVCFVPAEEAVRRCVERDNASEEKARSILASQLSNKKRLEHANVALCSLWEPEYTQKQVEKAWWQLKVRTTSEQKP